jgi:hypothetical protein
MSHSESSKSVNYQGLALTSLIVGAVATGVGLVSAKPATAGENPRISVAVTNIQSNTSSQSFAAEIVAPATDRYFTTGTVTVNYATAGSDPSQVVINDATLAATPVTYTATTVESATARAINNALGENRYGDVIGLVNAYNGPPASAENPSASVALTNIQSNSNSQSFASEIVAPFANFQISAIGVADGGLTYANNIADASQIFLTSAQAQATITAFEANTVDAATARAIDSAVSSNRYGDVIGIVGAYGNKGFAEGAQNPSVSVALTNIQSNTNSQSFAAEIVAPETGVYFSIATGTITYATLGATSDSSQVRIATGAITATASTNTTSTVERSVANAIDATNSNNRYGDVMGIVKAWQGGSSAALD